MPGPEEEVRVSTAPPGTGPASPATQTGVTDGGTRQE